jgi:hypothetical protein
MTDEAVAAVAAPEPAATPSPDAPQGDAPAPAERAKEPARASIDRAFAALEGQSAAGASPKEPKPVKETKEAKEQPATPDSRERDEHGRFKAKETQAQLAAESLEPQAEAVEQPEHAPDKPKSPISEAPQRFSPDAKAAWSAIPDAVKGEVHRAIRDLEGGLTQYRQAFEPLKPFFDMAQKHETTVHDALARYTSLDMALASRDPQHKFSAIQELIEYAGLSPKEYAALVMGQKPDAAQSQSDQTIRALHQEIAALKQQIGGVTTSLQQRRTDEVKAQVEAFAREHPRMDDNDFTETVARLIQTGMATDLPSAYDMADRLKPAAVASAPKQPEAAHTRATTDASAQTRKGNLSIGGAPASGSNPVNRKAPATAREALDRAFAGAGLS